MLVGIYIRATLLPCTCLTTSRTVLPGLPSQHTPFSTHNLFVSRLTLLILPLQKRDGLPALLVYQNGEMVGNLLKVTDDLGVEFEMEDVETFLQE